jgi:hypothetical protein
MESETIVEYSIEYAKTDRSFCRLCGLKIEKDVLRVAGLVRAPKSDRLIEKWYHADCGFKSIFHHGVKHGVLRSPGDIHGLGSIHFEHQQRIVSWLFSTMNQLRDEKYSVVAAQENAETDEDDDEDEDSSEWSEHDDEVDEGYEESLSLIHI